MADNVKTAEITKYTKEQLRKSAKYKADVDILSVVLDDNTSYTFDEADKLIKKFKEKKVK